MGDLIQWKGHNLHVCNSTRTCATCGAETFLIELDTHEPFCSKKCMDTFLEQTEVRMRKLMANLHKCEDCKWSRQLDNEEQLEGGEVFYRCINPHASMAICSGNFEHWCGYYE